MVRYTDYWVEWSYTNSATRIIKIATSLPTFPRLSSPPILPTCLVPLNYSVIFKKSRRTTAERRARVEEARVFWRYFLFGSREFNGRVALDMTTSRRAARDISGESGKRRKRRKIVNAYETRYSPSRSQLFPCFQWIRLKFTITINTRIFLFRFVNFSRNVVTLLWHCVLGILILELYICLN